MSKLLKYPVPILFLLIAFGVLSGDPTVPISTKIPIVPGADRYSLAALFVVLAVASYLLIKKFEK